MTCKDCIHYDVCIQKRDMENSINKTGLPCTDFKDKSRFFELPFAIGQTVYRIVCDCDNCKHHNIEDCYERNACKLKIKEMNYRFYAFHSKIECFATREEAEKALKEMNK